ncbi:nucleotidyltransferase [Paremcibacter congregatus]|uniref:Nucleotidyltransferase n=1 Tax=Paremcibacter congregatus TaxID=2043170 RepID=A0A2G4YNN2_9PROT|nr:nucleotidyltransferase [Paremcibacter congregatus]
MAIQTARRSGEPPDPEGAKTPHVLTAPGQGGIRLRALNRAAVEAGLRQDQLLTDAQALCRALRVGDFDPAGDARALEKLTRSFTRYSPWVACDLPEGLVLESSGCDHLFGGEAKMLRHMQQLLTRMGLSGHLALASTLGAARALSRFGGREITLLSPGEEARALRPLPLAALRLSAPILERLSRVGFKTIGPLIDKPRAPLRARYGAELLHKLAQALGEAPETLSPLSPPPDYRRQEVLQEPILLLSQIKMVLSHLTEGLAADLQAAHKGARALTFSLYRVDGVFYPIRLGTGSPCYEADHMQRLFSEKLDLLQDEMNVGYGFDHLCLEAAETEILTAYQKDMTAKDATDDLRDFDRLLDRFCGRLGAEHVRTFAARASHIPERSQCLTPFRHRADAGSDWLGHLKSLQGGAYLGRPVVLLPFPEPVTVMAEVPDGPPVRFDWRRIRHQVAAVDGPERLSPEWWRRDMSGNRPASETRDYFRIEDEQGRRYWLYRAGLYERGETPRWYLQGLFA